MLRRNNELSEQKIYQLIGKLIEEIRFRKFPYRLGRQYVHVVKEFLRSGKSSSEFLAMYNYDGSVSIKAASLALRLFHDRVLQKEHYGRMILERYSWISSIREIPAA